MSCYVEKLRPILMLLLCILHALLCKSVPVSYQGTRRNTRIFGFGDGRYYHLNAVHNNRAYMKCIRYERGCLGRVIWRRGGHYRESSGHDQYVCQRDRFHPQEMELRQRILNRCRRLDMTSFHQIIREERRGFPVEVQLRVNYPRMRTSMRNARMENFPPPPQTLHQMTDMLQNGLLRVATMTLDGNDNLYASSVTGTDGSHSVIFASQRMLRFARDQPVFFADGTFRSRPAIPESAQVFTIVTSFQHRVIPVAWVIMESKTASAYVSVLRMLRILLGPQAAIRQVITDYENAQLPAWRFVFQNQGVFMQGCLFHMARAFVKYAKRVLGLHRFMRNGAVSRIIRLCISLALVPLDLIDRAFAVVMIAARNEGLRAYRRIRPFLRYVSRRWVNHPRRRMWMNCCGSENRTNNICESHNRQMSRLIGVRRPDIYRFLMALVEMEWDAFLIVNGIRQGIRLHRPRRLTSIMMDNRLRNYLHDLRPRMLNIQVPPVPPDEAILRYLERASHLFQNVYDDAVDDV